MMMTTTKNAERVDQKIIVWNALCIVQSHKTGCSDDKASPGPLLLYTSRNKTVSCMGYMKPIQCVDSYTEKKYLYGF